MSRTTNEAAAKSTDELAPTQWGWLLFVGVGVLAVALPFVVKNFVVFQITLAVIYAIAILGLNLLTGFNGQFSLGHSAFYAIGAYTAAIMMEHGGIAYYWTLPAAGVVCLVSGFLFGLPALRFEGIYLALATFALADATPQLFKASFLEHWTGGVQGIVIVKPAPPFGLPLSADQWLYFFTLGVATILYFCAANLVGSRTGRALVAVRDHPIAASAMGINVALYKSLTFGVSALYTGIAGALGAIAIQFVAPDSFTFALAVALFVGLVVGGVGSIAGTLFGGAFVLFVPNIAEHISKGLAGAVYGIILILLIYAMPTGAAGLVRWLTHRSVPKFAPLSSGLRAVGLIQRESSRPGLRATRTSHQAAQGGHLEGGSDEETRDVGLARRRGGRDLGPGMGAEEVRSRRE
jgi:branched-chain amino acid transport system permease protein